MTPGLTLESGARKPSGVLEWTVVLVVFYNIIFVFPFMFRAFFWEANWLLKIGTYGALIGAYVLGTRNSGNLTRLLSNRWAFSFIVLYLAYLLCLLLSSALNYQEHRNFFTGEIYDSLPNIVGTILLHVSAFIMAVSIRADLFRWIMDRYVDLMLACALGAIAVIIMVYVFGLSPLSSVSMLSEGAENFKEHEVYMRFYGVGFYRHNAMIAGLSLPRAQSFASEGAGFAYPLLLALFWAHFRRRHLSLLVLFITLILTWSVGAFITLAFIMGIRLAAKPLQGTLLLSFCISLALLLYLLAVFQTNVFDVYWDQKFNATESSGSGRVDDLKAVMGLILNEHFLGLGVGASPFIYPPSIATTLLAVVAGVGVPGLLLWASAYALIGVQVIYQTVRGSSEISALASCLLVLYLMSAQALGLDAHFLSWLILTGLLNRLSESPIESPSKSITSKSGSY